MRMIGLVGATALLLMGSANLASAQGWNTWNGCPPNYTIQDGVCKPYRGPYGPTYYRGYGYGRPYYDYGYRRRYYEPDPGAAIALGIIGTVGGLIARDALRHRHHHRRYHHRH